MERFFMALDCGQITVEEVQNYESAPSYQRAKSVWRALYTTVMEPGSFLSIRTGMHYERFHIVAYGTDVSRDRQLKAFRIMDKYRQEYLASGVSSTFVSMPEAIINEYFQFRKEAILRGEPVAHLSDESSLYETHTPRHKQMDVPAPVAVDPPFESIPLYRERQTQPIKVKQTRPFLERFYLQRRLKAEHLVAGMAERGITGQTKRLTLATEDALVLSATMGRKYHLTPSALAMISALMEHTQGTTVKTLPEQSIILKFETTPIDLEVYPPVAGLFFASPLQAYQAWEAKNHSGLFTFPKQAESIWVLSILKEDGDTLLNLLYDCERHAWKVPEHRACPDSACKQIMSVEEQVQRGAFTIWQLCPKCETIARYFARWLPIALLAIAGEFAEEAEPIMREITETITRKEKIPGKGKYKEKKEEARFKIVTFDASVKRAAPSVLKNGETPEESASPSWLDLAIEEGTVVYVKRGFGKSTRNLDPLRNPRWKEKRTVPVRSYEKRIPMTVANLQRVITRVVASKYEVARTNPS
jgi:hypothetical protein